MAAAAIAAQQAAALLQQQQQLAAIQREETMMFERCRATFAGACEAEEAAAAVVDRVVHLATESMISNHLDRLAIPYTVRCIVKETLDYIHCAFIGQDDGSTIDQHWHADPQANQVTVDPWARAAIGLQMPVRRLGNGGEFDAAGNTTTSSLANALSGTSGPFAGTRSRAPANASSGKKAALSASSGGGKNSSSTTNAKQNTSSSAPGQLSPANRSSDNTVGGGTKASTKAPTKNGAGASASGGATSGENGAQNTNGMTSEEVEYLEQARAEAKRRAEARALQDRISKQLDDVKKEGNFTVDGSTGRVISIVNFDANANAAKRALEGQRFAIGNAPETLGPVKAPPGVGANGNRNAPPRAGASNSAPAALTGAGSTAAIAQPPKRSGVSRRPEASDFYVEEASYGPMIDALTPAGGVAVREKDVTLKGEFKVPKTRVSRAEYLKMASVGLTGVVGPDEGDNGGNSPVAQAPIPVKASPLISSNPNHNGGSNTLLSSQQPLTTSGSNNVYASNNEYRPQQIAALPVSKAKAGGDGGAKGNSTDQRSSPRQKRAELAKQLSGTSPQAQRKRRGTEVRTGVTSLSDDDY